jgi:hypothetical protein
MVTHGFRNQTIAPAKNHNCNASHFDPSQFEDRYEPDGADQDNVAQQLKSLAGSVDY